MDPHETEDTEPLDYSRGNRPAGGLLPRWPYYVLTAIAVGFVIALFCGVALTIWGTRNFGAGAVDRPSGRNSATSKPTLHHF